MRFTQKLLRFSLLLIVFFLIILGLHYLLIDRGILPAFMPFYSTHGFLFVITLLSFAIVLLAFYRSDKAGFVFVGMSMLKMMAAVAFLFPLIKEDAEGLIVFVLQFMALYFIYLFLEAILVLRLIKSAAT